MGIVLPVTSTVFISRGPQFADRVVAIAEQDTRVFNALLRAAKYGAYLGLASIASTISVAVLVDIGGIRPDSFIAGRVIGPELNQVYAERSTQNGTGGADTASAVRSAVPSNWP